MRKRGLVVGVLLLTAAWGAAEAQHVQEYPLGTGFGHRGTGVINTPCRLSDDAMVIFSEGAIPDPGALDESLLIVTGLGGGVPSFQDVLLLGVLGPYELKMRSIDRLADDAFLFRGARRGEDGPYCSLIVVSDIYGTYGPTLSIVDDLSVPVSTTGGYLEPAVLQGGDAIVLPSPGPDGMMSTSDDVVVFARGLLSANPIETWVLPATRSLGRAATTFYDDRLAVMCSRGLDGLPVNADDGFVVAGFDTAQLPYVQWAPAGHAVGEWADDPRPVVVGNGLVVSPTTLGFGLGTAGPAPGFVMLRCDGHNAYTVPLPILDTALLAPWGAPHPVSDGTDYRMAYTDRGADGVKGSDDDELVVVKDLLGAYTVERHVMGHGLGMAYWERAPILFGDRLITLDPGADSIWGWGNNDAVSVFDDLWSGTPQETHHDLGLSLLEVQPAHERSLWLLPMGMNLTYLSGLGTPSAQINESLFLWNSAPRIRVSPWTWATTRAGPNAGYTNDPLVLLRNPYVGFDGLGTPDGPRLGIWSDPMLGNQTFHLDMCGAPCNQPYVLVLSESDTAVSPLDLDYTVAFDAMFGVSDAIGGAQWNFALPNDPSFVGWRVFVQALVLSGDDGGGFFKTDRLHLHL